jgi:hypothetical protein
MSIRSLIAIAFCCAELLGTTCSAQTTSPDASLPPTVEQNPSWPFPASHHSTAVYRIVWTDGSTSNVIPRTDGGYDIRGGDANGTTLIPTGTDYVIATGDGNFATMQHLPTGGYHILTGDGTFLSITPRTTGDFSISNTNGQIGTIVPVTHTQRSGFGSANSLFPPSF